MQKTRGVFAVKVDDVAIGNHAELREIEVRIQTLQRIESPGDQFDALRQHCFTLRQLQLVPEIKIAIRRFHREHVRVMRDLAVFLRDETINETDQRLAIESAKQHAARGFRGDEMRERHHVEIRNAPNLFL